MKRTTCRPRFNRDSQTLLPHYNYSFSPTSPATTPAPTSPYPRLSEPPFSPQPNPLRMVAYQSKRYRLTDSPSMDENTDMLTESTGTDVPSIFAAWMFADALDWRSHVNGICMRRGCRQRRAKRCKSCGTVEYCGVECQARCVP